jgi:hypothetical protein
LDTSGQLKRWRRSPERSIFCIISERSRAVELALSPKRRGFLRRARHAA